MIELDISDKTILEQLKDNGTVIECPCRGLGTCGKCKVKILEGKVTPVTYEEKRLLSNSELSEGIRLACQCKTINNTKIDTLFQHGGDIKILTEGVIPSFNINPAIKKISFNLSKEALSKFSSINSYFQHVTGINSAPSLDILKKLPSLLSLGHGEAIVYRGEILDVDTSITNVYGMAIDIGTTTVACSLINLLTFEEIDSSSFINPQKEFGLDVLSRIHYASDNDDGISKLQQSIVKRINYNIKNLCNKNGIDISSIYEVVIGANSTMIHCLLGIPIDTLGKSPYISVLTENIYVRATTIGININCKGKIYCIPAVSTYIGGDIVAGILASRLDLEKGNTLFIDIGTNGEIVLSSNGNLVSCSCAAGPALEGMNISCGMRADTGAIESLKISDNKMSINTIGNSPPIGLCGSGILETISELLSNDILGINGRLKTTSPLVHETDGKRSVLLYENENKIYITQKDIRQVQLAKGAILSGFITLLEYKNITIDNLNKVIIAGQFGKHLSPESLTGVGIIPKNLKDKIKYIGNSSSVGAFMCLLSIEERKKAEDISRNVDYIELSNMENYEKIFTKALLFK
jgi:uncharacterized 2Fe-2S/4Fe-4S cluster protein (DUF4445 family)